MSDLSRRKITAWTCAACMAATWIMKNGDAGSVDNWIIGGITGGALGITLSANRTAPPMLLTLSICGVMFSILAVLAARNQSGWVCAGYITSGVVFLLSQWAYIRSFRTPEPDPAGIDPSQNPGEPL